MAHRHLKKERKKEVEMVIKRLTAGTLAAVMNMVLVLALSLGLGACGSNETGADKGVSADAITGCVIGADCNVRDQACNTDPKDPLSPQLFCIIIDGASSGTFQKSCRKDSLCTPGETCKRTWTTPDSGPDEWFICTTSNKLVPLFPGETSADTGTTTDTTPVDTGSPDSGPTDTGPADTGTPDSGPADTGPADTGPADTGTADTGSLDTGTPDTGTADTGTLDTGTADSTVADTTPADTASDSSVVDSSTDSSVADTAIVDSASDSSDAGLSCSLPTTAMDCRVNMYGCKNPDIGAFCTDMTSSPPQILYCKCGDGAGLGWLLPWGTACSSVPVCTAKCDGGVCADTGTDATTDSTPTDTSSDVSETSSDGTVDSTADATDSSVSDVADSSSDAADSTSDASDTLADSTSDVSDAPCIPGATGVDMGPTKTVFTWTAPAGFVQKGAVNLVGQYYDSSATGGIVYDWTSTPGTGLITLVSDGCGKFYGSLPIPSGSTFLVDIKRVDATMPTGVGWTGDQSSTGTGGCTLPGRAMCCNLDFGVVTITKAGVPVSFAHVSNGKPSTGPDAVCDTTGLVSGGGKGMVYMNYTGISP